MSINSYISDFHPRFFTREKKVYTKIKSSSLTTSPLHTATWPTQRHVTEKLTSKSANDMSLIPRPSAVLLSSWVIWEPIFMTFLSPLHECACFRSCETFSPLQAMVESSAIKQQDKKRTNFYNKFKETTQNNINRQYFFCLCFHEAALLSGSESWVDVRFCPSAEFVLQCFVPDSTFRLCLWNHG